MWVWGSSLGDKRLILFDKCNSKNAAHFLPSPKALFLLQLNITW